MVIRWEKMDFDNMELCREVAILELNSQTWKCVKNKLLFGMILIIGLSNTIQKLLQKNTHFALQNAGHLFSVLRQN